MRKEVGQAIKDGYTNFCCGFDSGLDLEFAAYVRSLQAERPDITLEAWFSYRNRLHKVLQSPRTKALVCSCSIISICADAYSPEAVYQRNQQLLETAQRVITPTDGTCCTGDICAMTAQKMGKEVRVLPIPLKSEKTTISPLTNRK